jgi:opacity protein-like surface antigen
VRTKLTVAFLLACVVAVPAMADSRIVEFGIKGGVNFAALTFDPERDPKPEVYPRFAGAGTIGFRLARSLWVDTDFLYVMKGARLEWEAEETRCGDCRVKDELGLDYFVINPMFRYAPLNDQFMLFLVLGGEIGWLVRANQTREYLRCDTACDTENDYGLNVGAGVEIFLGNSAVTLEGRFSLGRADIRKDKDQMPGDSGIDRKTNTRGMYVLAGLRF